jgi:hypothetical protein
MFCGVRDPEWFGYLVWVLFALCFYAAQALSNVGNGNTKIIMRSIPTIGFFALMGFVVGIASSGLVENSVSLGSKFAFTVLMVGLLGSFTAKIRIQRRNSDLG